MKSYNEMAESVLKRRDRHAAQQKKRIKRTASVVLCCCLAVLSGAGAWYAGILINGPAQSGLGANNTQSDGNTHSAAVQLENSEKPGDITSPQTIRMAVNKVKDIISADMDVQYSSYKQLPEQDWKMVSDAFYEFAGISYEDFTSKVSGRWDIDDFYAISTMDRESGEYRLHDYGFHCQAESGKIATIAVCTFEQPLRDCYIECKNPELSEINGTHLTVYGFENTFIAQFSYQNINYDVETRDVELEELEELLMGLLQ